MIEFLAVINTLLVLAALSYWATWFFDGYYILEDVSRTLAK